MKKINVMYTEQSLVEHNCPTTNMWTHLYCKKRTKWTKWGGKGKKRKVFLTFLTLSLNSPILKKLVSTTTLCLLCSSITESLNAQTTAGSYLLIGSESTCSQTLFEPSTHYVYARCMVSPLFIHLMRCRTAYDPAESALPVTKETKYTL